MTNTTQEMTRTEIRSRHGAAPYRLAAVVGAAISASIAWTFLTQVSGIDLTVPSGGSTKHVGLVAVIVISLLVGCAGWGLLAILERRARRPYRTWTVTALVAFVVSLLGPLGATTGGAVAALAALHLTVATILIIGLPHGCAGRR